jgi:hypothetical protein
LQWTSIHLVNIMGSVKFSDNRDGTIYFAVCCVIQFLAIVATVLRLWSRKIQRVTLQLNDYAILCALVSLKSSPRIPR